MLQFGLKNVRKYNRHVRVTVRATRDNHNNRVELYHDMKRGASHFRIDSAGRLLRDAVPFVDHHRQASVFTALRTRGYYFGPLSHKGILLK